MSFRKQYRSWIALGAAWVFPAACSDSGEGRVTLADAAAGGRAGGEGIAANGGFADAVSNAGGSLANDGFADAISDAGGSLANGGFAGSASDAGGSVANSGTGGSPEVCDDVYPYEDGYTCEEQASWGKCDESWLLGYCDYSCGRCGEGGGPDEIISECGETGTAPDLTADAGAAPTLDCGTAPADECEMNTGLTHACRKRFALGINYAWRDFGADFGGLEAWSLPGISGAMATYNADLARMKANGASVVRWWMFPDLRGDAVGLDADGVPSGLSANAVADIVAALELAQRNDLYLALTLFSFDAFRASRDEGDVHIPGLSEIVRDAASRQALIENVVRPVAQTVAENPYASRLLAWDVINEPEWAVEATGAADQDFTPNGELDAVTLTEMKALINETLAELGTQTPSILRSVGWAAAKWAWAFEDVTAVELHQPHIYGWVNDYWPYTSTPAELGYGSKPTVMGEFFLTTNPFAADTPTFSDIVTSWYDNGYAGAWAWDYFSGCIADPPKSSVDMTLIQQFAADHGCSVTY
ncbi:endo-1,4-beta-glucanase [Myxococcota bacterium]